MLESINGPCLSLVLDGRVRFGAYSSLFRSLLPHTEYVQVSLWIRVFYRLVSLLLVLGFFVAVLWLFVAFCGFLFPIFV